MRAKGKEKTLNMEQSLTICKASAGSGKTFNWDVLADCKREFFLAGGLAPENAAQAVRTLRPFALDVSSGVETDGSKDKAKVEEFINNVRTAQSKG